MLVSEFRIKQQLAAIEVLPDRPLRKARRILRLGQFVAQGAVRMSMLADWYLSIGDLGRAVRFEKAKLRLVQLHGDIRRRARKALSCSDEKLEYGYNRQPSDSFPLTI